MSMGTFQVGTTGHPIKLEADGSTIYKPIGFAWAWDKVNAAVSDTVLSDETPIKTGEKYLRYGSIMVPVNTPTEQTAAITGTPTGGTFTPSLVINGESYPAEAQNHNVSGADLKTALNEAYASGYPAFNEDTVPPVDSVALAGTTYTITFNAHYGSVAEMTGTDAFTGGSTPKVTYAVTAAGDASNGKWAQWDNSAPLVRGFVGILNCTIKLWTPSMTRGYWDEDNGGLIEGGLVWSERLNTTADKHTAILTAMPLLRFAPAE